MAYFKKFLLRFLAKDEIHALAVSIWLVVIDMEVNKRYTIKDHQTEYIAGGLLGVEKVKPDPLNLSVNTVVGKQSINIMH